MSARDVIEDSEDAAVGTRVEFSDDQVPEALSMLLREGRLRDAALVELYACTPLSMEQLVKCRVHQLEREDPTQSFVLNFVGRRGSRRVHLDDQATSVLATWVGLARRQPHEYIFPSLRSTGAHLNARHARRIVDGIFNPRAPRCTPRRHTDEVLRETLCAANSSANVHGCWLSQWPWVECALWGHGKHPDRRCVNRCAGAPGGALMRSMLQPLQE
jgi:hypothetical protein